MRIWLINPQEVVPTPQYRHERLLRMGALATYAANLGHDVTWWTSTFSHRHKVFYYDHDTSITIEPGFKVNMLNVGGYRRNVSIARLRYLSRFGNRLRYEMRRQSELPDVIMASYPPIEGAYEATLFGKEKGIPVVVDIRDMWPYALEMLVPSALRPIARVLLYPMHKKAEIACRDSSAVIGITDEFVEWGVAKGRRLRTDRDRAFPFSYSPVVPSEQEIKEAEKFWDNLGLTSPPGSFVVTYLGNIGRRGGFPAIIHAARILRSRGLNVKFILAGTGDRLETYRTQAIGDQNILFPGWVDYAKIYVLLRRSSVGIDPMPETFDFTKTLNNKAIEYLSAGLPLLVSPHYGVLHRLVSEHECGLSYPYLDGNALAQSIEYLIRNPDVYERMRKRALETYMEKFSPKVVYGGMLKFFAELCAS